MVPDAVLMDTQEELTDLLDRKAFVARLIDVVEILSENRKNASFAVNGAWGVGKTFVLNRFEEEIAKYPLEEDGPRKYLVFHYDCWKYDYYEEPLIALVAALTDSIDKQTNFISADKRTTFKVVLKEIIAGLVEVGSVKTGFDIKKIFETIKSAKNKATQEIADSHDFDVYFSFNCILENFGQQSKIWPKNRPSFWLWMNSIGACRSIRSRFSSVCIMSWKEFPMCRRSSLSTKSNWSVLSDKFTAAIPMRNGIWRNSSLSKSLCGKGH